MYDQCCGTAKWRLQLRLLMAKVPEPTTAPTPTYLGRLQAKRGGYRRLRLHTLKSYIFIFTKVNY